MLIRSLILSLTALFGVIWGDTAPTYITTDNPSCVIGQMAEYECVKGNSMYRPYIVVRFKECCYMVECADEKDMEEHLQMIEENICLRSKIDKED